MKIYRYVKRNSINEQYTNGQTKYYSDTVRTAIIKEFSTKKTVRPFEHLEQHDEDVNVFSLLKEQVNKQSEELKIKNKQIENKDTQITQMQNLLDQQQRLALQDKQMLNEYKSENNKLKALKTPNHNIEQEREFAETMRATYEEELVQLNQELSEKQKLRAQAEEERNDLMEKQRKLLAREQPKKWWKFWD